MAQPDGDTPEASQAFADRQADFQPRVVEPDWTTSPEAMAVLREQGVDAWRRWCAENAPSA